MSNKLQLDELDGIRGFAVLFVLFSHLSNEKLRVFSFSISGAGSGQIGVYLFFALSSFLLTRALLYKKHNGQINNTTWMHYTIRRITRIYPFYIFALLFTVVASKNSWSLFPNMSLYDGLMHLLLIDGKLHFWTIATEIKFYLVLPVIIYISILVKNTGAFIAVLITISVAAIIYQSLLPIGKTSTFLDHLPIFLMGSIAAALYDNGNFFYKMKGSKIALYSSYGSCFLLVLLMPKLINKITRSIFDVVLPMQQPAMYLLWGLLCGILILGVCCSDKGWLKFMMKNRIIRLIGNMSFSLYINHWFIMKFASNTSLPTLAKIILFWGMTFVISYITYRLIEKPFSRLSVRSVSKSFGRI